MSFTNPPCAQRWVILAFGSVCGLSGKVFWLAFQGGMATHVRVENIWYPPLLIKPILYSLPVKLDIRSRATMLSVQYVMRRMTLALLL